VPIEQAELRPGMSVELLNGEDKAWVPVGDSSSRPTQQLILGTDQITVDNSREQASQYVG